MPVVLLHALPQSIGAVPLTLVITVVLGAYLAIGALGTRRAGALVGAQPVGGGRLRRADDGAAAVGAGGPAAGTADVAQGTADEDVAHVADSRLTAGRAAGLLGLAAIAVLAVTGPQDASSNLTDVAVLSLLWGLVALTSAVAGAWWGRVDPLRAIAAPLATAPAPLPASTATAGAVASLLAWAWAQLLASPGVAAFQAMLLAHVVVHVAAAVRWGPAWLEAAEPLHVLSRTMRLLRPGGGGPLARLVALPDDDRLRWITGILIGWSITDLVVETDAWHDAAPSWGGPVVLLVATLGMAALVRAVSARFRLGPAFVAVAGGWVAAHYLSILLIEGQGVPIWLTDPFGTGADLLGRRGDLIDLEPLPLWLMALLQAVPFVAGHLAGVVVLQRRAAALATRPGQVGPATFLARALIGALLLAGIWLQLGGA